MKRIANLIIIILAMCFVLSGISACGTAQEEPLAPEPITYKIEFDAQIGGKILGEKVQTVAEGDNSSKVIAIANEGYYFAGWADTGYVFDETVKFYERVIYNVRESRPYLAMFEKVTLKVEYVTDGNGTVNGSIIQKRKYGESGDSVTAVPNIGYRFKEWSDGGKEATRSEKDLTENKKLTAEFEIITNEYIYDYKLADGNCSVPSISLTYGRLNGIIMPVPTRLHGAFGGWYADRYLTKRVADENGNVVIGDELFYENTDKLYAKWIAENTRPFKILMVYATEVKGTFMRRDKTGTKRVDYKMTELERTLCGMITEKIEWELNDLAVADFQVNEYYTTVPLTDKDVQFYTKDNYFEPERMPEIQDITPYYDAVLLSFSLDDYVGELHNDAGAARVKYGHVHFDQCFSLMMFDKKSIEGALDPLCPYWLGVLEPYLHELAHTIELRVSNLFDYHEVARKYTTWLDPISGTQHYFLNKAVIDGETVGIPYEFWEGKVALVHYEPQSQYGYVKSKIHHDAIEGHIANHDMQHVILGNYAIEVVAVPFRDEYEFVMWSDGVTTPERKDFITGDFHVYAIFRQKEQ